ncbi:hypothetical protein DL765_006762 [Monosporascus sp. GIB2]|nr:hypothetical protein DL765_006762 [Monosporascus sp. GIB2]
MVSDLGTQFEVAATEGSDDPTTAPRTLATAGETQLIESAVHRLETEHDTAVSGDSSAANDESELLSDFPTRMALQDDVGNLVTRENGDLVVGDRFWTVFCSEVCRRLWPAAKVEHKVEHIFEAVRDRSRPPFFAAGTSSAETHPERSHINYYSFLKSQASIVGADLYPLPSQMMFIWHVFEERIDPFLKVLHVPSIAGIVRTLNGDWASLEPGVSALILAVSFAVVSVLSGDEVMVSFGVAKKDIIARYRLGTEQALERADLLRTTDLRAVEAYTIYLNILQHSGESVPAWSLLGALVRVGVRLQLHHDGSHFSDMLEFEKERRRRLWWQICLMDARATGPRSSDFSVSESMFDTKMPANVNDADISANLSTVTAVSGRTDMTFSLIRYQLWRLSRQVRSYIATAAFAQIRILDLFRRGVQEIEETHLVGLDTDRPIDSFITNMARLSIARIELILQQELTFPRSHSLNSFDSLTVPSRRTTSEAAFSKAISILEYTWTLEHKPAWRPWRWLLGSSLTPWNALNIVLVHICSTPWKQEYSQAWSTAQKSFDGIPESVKSTPQYVSLYKLMWQAASLVSPQTQRVTADMDMNTPSAFNLSNLYDPYRESERTPPSVAVVHGQNGVEGGLLAETTQQNWDILPDVAWDLEDWVNI